MPVAEEDARVNVLGGKGDKHWHRNCRGEKPDPVLLDLPKARAPKITLFQGISPFKTPQQSPQPLWLETPEVMGGGAGRLRNEAL